MGQQEILLNLHTIEAKLHQILSVLPQNIENDILSLVQLLLYEQANLVEGNMFDRATKMVLN